MKIGINVMGYPGDWNPIDNAIQAEAEGFESIWMTDGNGRMDALTAAAAIGARTSRVRIGLGIVPVFNRPPAVLAASAVALSHVAPDRVVLGVGSSSQTMIERWYGMEFTRPLTRVRETVELMRHMFTGERTAYDGKTVRSHGFRLTSHLKGGMPIYIAALRPGMLELAGEIGDGVVLNLTPSELLPRVLEHVDTGAKRSGRRVEDLEIVSLLNTFVTDDLAAGTQAMRRVALGYYSTGVYASFLAWLGRPHEAEQIQAGFAERDREKTNAALSDEFVQRLGLVGSAADVRSRLDEYAKAGLDTAVIWAASQDEAEYRATRAAVLAAA